MPTFFPHLGPLTMSPKYKQSKNHITRKGGEKDTVQNKAVLQTCKPNMRHVKALCDFKLLSEMKTVFWGNVLYVL